MVCFPPNILLRPPPQTPFTLTLRIWDIYILEGERVLPTMSYTILKLHKSKRSAAASVPRQRSGRLDGCLFSSTEHLMKLSMEELVEFLQVTLSKNFFFEDDFVVEQLQASMAELRRAKLELPVAGRAGDLFNAEVTPFPKPLTSIIHKSKIKIRFGI